MRQQVLKSEIDSIFDDGRLQEKWKEGGNKKAMTQLTSPSWVGGEAGQ